MKYPLIIPLQNRLSIWEAFLLFSKHCHGKSNFLSTRAFLSFFRLSHLSGLSVWISSEQFFASLTNNIVLSLGQMSTELKNELDRYNEPLKRHTHESCWEDFKPYINSLIWFTVLPYRYLQWDTSVLQQAAGMKTSTRLIKKAFCANILG